MAGGPAKAPFDSFLTLRQAPPFPLPLPPPFCALGALPVDERRAVLGVLLPGHPQLLEGAQAGQDGTAWGSTGQQKQQDAAVHSLDAQVVQAASMSWLALFSPGRAPQPDCRS